MDIKLLIIIIIWIILSIVFAFTDLEISKAVANPNNEVGRFGAVHGTYPGVIIVTISFSVIILNIITCIVKKDRFIFYWTNIAIVIVILYIVNPVVFVFITKNLWGRVRFVNLYSDYSNFTPWYVINGYNGHKSFTSYHSAMGWMFLPLIIYLKDIKHYIKWIGIILIIFWGSFVSISRVLIGAHYMSDILFPTMLSFVIVHVMYEKVYRRKIHGKRLRKIISKI
jgi:membrane-associated phospholipid phosphatase